MSAKIIAIANHKGGVGKTTTTACLGAALALSNKRVLVVDLDAQQNLTYMLTGTDEIEVSIYHALVKKAPLPILTGFGGVDIIPASLELARADADLATAVARERRLSILLEKVSPDYDFILLDCPPALGTITTNALVAANEIYIPLTAEALPFKGLAMLQEVVDEVKQLVNPSLVVGGVIFTRYNNRNLNRAVETKVRLLYGERVFDTKIRENITVAEVPMAKTTIFDYDNSSAGAKDYLALAEEVIRRNNRKQ